MLVLRRPVEPKGEYRHFREYGRPIHDESGRHVRTVGIVQDITRHKQVEEALTNALESEKEFNKLQREFVSLASHELRTPITIIDSTAQRIERTMDRSTPDELRGRLRIVRDAVERMTELIEGTLRTGRFDAGEIGMNLEPTDIRELLATVVERQRLASPTYGISLAVDDLPERMWLDRNLIDQALTNLLSNAVKYSPDGGAIQVTASRDADGVAIAVRDRGVGIPRDEIPRLFERYFRASTGVGIPGTGLGLYLAKQLVTMHGGAVHVDSAAGEGTTFTVRLPAGGGRKPSKDRRAGIGVDSALEAMGGAG